MAPEELFTQTPRGSSIQRVEGGKFIVCDGEHLCFFTRSLYFAEEHLEEIEHGYVFPNSTFLRIARIKLTGFGPWPSIRDLVTGIRNY